MRAVHLQCEYMTEPMGIDCQFPLLLWNCEDGVRQSAYEVRAVTDSVLLHANGLGRTCGAGGDARYLECSPL